MSASAAPSCCATLATIASSSAADVATARSNRSISAGTSAGVGERLRLARPEDRVDPVGDPDHDARTDRDSFVHDTLSLANPTAIVTDLTRVSRSVAADDLPNQAAACPVFRRHPTRDV